MIKPRISDPMTGQVSPPTNDHRPVTQVIATPAGTTRETSPVTNPTRHMNASVNWRRCAVRTATNTSNSAIIAVTPTPTTAKSTSSAMSHMANANAVNTVSPAETYQARRMASPTAPTNTNFVDGLVHAFNQPINQWNGPVNIKWRMIPHLSLRAKCKGGDK